MGRTSHYDQYSAMPSRGSTRRRHRSGRAAPGQPTVRVDMCVDMRQGMPPRAVPPGRPTIELYSDNILVMTC